MNRFLLVSLLAGITAASTPLLAQEEGGRPAGGRRPASPVKAQMEKLDEAVDAIAEFLKKPEGDAPMAQIAGAHAALQEAKQHAPRTTQGQPEDKQAAFVSDYKIQINKTIRGLLDLEDAMIEQDWKAAEKALEALKAMEKAGHEKFKPKRRARGNRGGGQNGGGGEGGGGGGGGGK